MPEGVSIGAIRGVADDLREVIPEEAAERSEREVDRHVCLTVVAGKMTALLPTEKVSDASFRIPLLLAVLLAGMEARKREVNRRNNYNM